MEQGAVLTIREIASRSPGTLRRIIMLNRRQFIQQAMTVASLGPLASGAGSLSGADATREVKPFGNAIVIGGKPRDRGRQYGRRFSAGIAEFLEREIYAAFVGRNYLKDEMLRYADACAKVIRAECPIIADELEGMAEGSGRSLAEHVLITLHEELYHRGVLPPVPHCTAVAVGKPETRDGSTYVGQTWDWMPSVAGMSDVVKWHRDDGPSLLAYGFPGLWVGAGLNAHGLALCWTSAALGQQNQIPRVGLPSYVFLAHLLYPESLEAVIEAARRNKHAGWFTFVMADGNGRLLNVEGSPAEIAVEESQGRLIRISYGTRQMTATPADQPIQRHPRCTTMDNLLASSAGRTDLAAMQQNFGDPARGICVGKGTIDMMVFDTTRRTAHLSRGPDYGTAWKTYAFSA
jgi:isopenicillin-N N-acyltransferase like protein